MRIKFRKPVLITILGPTASGKTQLAARLAKRVGGEVISADSRQVYRGMNLGTGKDYEDYIVDGYQVPCHLLDVVDPGYKYNVFEYQADFLRVYNELLQREKPPVLCGGSGLYLEAVVSGYKLIPVPENPELRSRLSHQTHEELTGLLESYKSLHNKTDIDTRKRLIRAIEIEEYYAKTSVKPNPFPRIDSVVFGVKFPRNQEMDRITLRLTQRLTGGLVEEVESLLKSGIKPEDLIYYGLEYKFVTQYILGELTYDQMFRGLNIAIRQFAKRQMTWFRRMERNGIHINWIEGSIPLEQKVELILSRLGV